MSAGGPWDPPGTEPVLARTRFRVTPGDVTAAWRANLRWRYTRPVTMAVPVGLGLLFTGAEAVLAPGAGVAVALPLVLLPALAVIGRLGHYALLPLLARRTFRQTRSYHEEWTVELTRSGARARAGDLDHFVPWGHYVAWSETPRVILLYHNEAMFQFVPRAAVTAEGLEVLRGLLGNLPRR